jgi:hypothetical protein
MDDKYLNISWKAGLTQTPLHFPYLILFNTENKVFQSGLPKLPRAAVSVNKFSPPHGFSCFCELKALLVVTLKWKVTVAQLTQLLWKRALVPA